MPKTKSLILAHWYVAFAALFVGVYYGLRQSMARAGILAQYDYYKGLTVHGVLNALVFTTLFIAGFLYLTTETSLKRQLKHYSLAWLSFFLMLAGTLTAAVTILKGDASVLYTFYPPLRAHAAFYIGLTVVVVGSWLAGAEVFLTYRAWRKDNPSARIPLMFVGTATTYILWFIATIGVAAEMLFLLIPWSLGFTSEVNPLLARTLFWYFGHPLVYFWLLPAYLTWYTIVPRIAGGKLYSDPMARVAFILFILFSVPVGTHHQFADPGISTNWKAFHAFLTFLVAFPSLLTAFNLAASLEYAGRKRGGSGLFGWWSKLPYGDPAFAAFFSSMFLFIWGGISGIVNASYNVNIVVHNTSFLFGHFHLTLGSAVALTFMGLVYLIYPRLTSKELWGRGLAVLQAYLWLIGMLIFSFSNMAAGRLGVPRRTNLGLSPEGYDFGPLVHFLEKVSFVGGIILYASSLLFFIVFLGTIFCGKKTEPKEEIIPVTECYQSVDEAPRVLDSWKVWLSIAVVLVLIAYVPLLIQVVGASKSVPGFYPNIPTPLK
ncbi:MAG: cbb3-type cytochrome c oxidase subunit I [Candidatus Methanosuratincola sp.]|jgi:cytochrome c oxidase subunit 1